MLQRRQHILAPILSREVFKKKLENQLYPFLNQSQTTLKIYV